jgi:uncharacterized membrane protein YraQ (UPF0718 family)
MSVDQIASTSRPEDSEAAGHVRGDGGRPRLLGQTEVVLACFLLLVLSHDWLTQALSAPALRTWSAMFVAIVVQSLPFLVLGVILAAAISTLISERLLRRVVPRNPALAVPVAGIAGIGLIGCECASVPIASSVMRRGVGSGAALTFLLAAPAVNPVVLVSTAIAFPGRPMMVLARFVASMTTAVVVGWIWVWVGGRVPPRLSGATARGGGQHVDGFLANVQHDFLHTSGFLVVGASISAAVNSFIPRSVLSGVGSHPVLAVLVMAGFAFVVALCSQTDAFIAASLISFSYTARLVFLVVGPAMDVKLAVLEAGAFGRRFAAAFVPLVLVLATCSAVLTAWWLL